MFQMLGAQETFILHSLFSNNYFHSYVMALNEQLERQRVERINR